MINTFSERIHAFPLQKCAPLEFVLNEKGAQGCNHHHSSTVRESSVVADIMRPFKCLRIL
jgi:hypothetical protein